jgi:hypothetical protein
MCVGSGQGDDAAATQDPIPLLEHPGGAVEQHGHCFDVAPRIRQQRPGQGPDALITPFAVGVQPLDAVERQIPLMPLKFRLS